MHGSVYVSILNCSCIMIRQEDWWVIAEIIWGIEENLSGIAHDLTDNKPGISQIQV